MFDYICGLIADRGAQVRITEGTVCDIHRISVEGIYPCGGRYTTILYRRKLLGGHVLPHPSLIRVRLIDLLDWVNSLSPQSQREPYEAAVFHYRLTEIHPFNGANGRVARQLMALFLMKRGYDPLLIRELFRFTRTHKKLYIETLQCGELQGEPVLFLLFIVYGLLHAVKRVAKTRNIKLPQLALIVRRGKRELRDGMRTLAAIPKFSSAANSLLRLR